MDQKKTLHFLVLWVVNTVIILILAAALKNGVVLGNDKVSKPIAGVLAGLVLTLVPFLSPLVVKKYGLKVKNENIYLALYFAVGFVVVWIIKRFALTTGLGVSNVLLVVLIAILATLAFWAVTKALGYLLRTK